VEKRYGLWVSIVAALLSTALLVAPAASGKARVIKTLGPEDGTKDSPAVIAINRKTNTVYVSNVGGEDGGGFNPDMVSVIDGKTDRIVTNIVVDDHPFGLAVDEKANLVYVANVGGKLPTSFVPLAGGGGTIMVIDGKTNTVREEFDIPPPPGGHLPNTTAPIENGLPAYLAFDPETGYLWVANTGEVGGDEPRSVPGYLSVYDTERKQWRGGIGIPAGVTPIHPDIDPGLNRVYVTSFDSGIVTVVNSHSRKLVKRIKVMPEAYGASIDTRRHRYYIGHADSRAASETEPLKPFQTVLEVLNTRTNRLLKPVYAGGFTRNSAVDPVTGRVYVNNLATGTMTILGPNLKVRQTVRVGVGPRGIAFNSDTRKLYVGNVSASAGVIIGGPGLDARPDTISVIRDPVQRRKARKRAG
jgi:DNA-binding beta-propeller fold protein YncE